MLTALMLKQAYAHGAAIALGEFGYPLQTALNLGVKLAEEAINTPPQDVMPQEMQPEMQPEMQQEMQPERRLLGPNPGIQNPEEQGQPDVGSLVESGGLGVQSPDMQGQEAPPGAYADGSEEDIYGALSE